MPAGLEVGYINTTQVMEILGVSRQRLYTLRTRVVRNDELPLPQPAGYTRAGTSPYWDYNDIVQYKLNRNTVPGRPRVVAPERVENVEEPLVPARITAIPQPRTVIVPGIGGTQYYTTTYGNIVDNIIPTTFTITTNNTTGGADWIIPG